MKTYRTYFERFNFGYNPPLKQTSDVVFKTNIPYDDEHMEEFDKVMWKALRKQNPQWNKYEGPLPGDMGWSSILGGREVIELF